MNGKIIGIAFEIAAEIARYILEAFQNNDPASLQKVTDILPEGHTLRARAAFIMAHRQAVEELGDRDDG